MKIIGTGRKTGAGWTIVLIDHMECELVIKDGCIQYHVLASGKPYMPTSTSSEHWGKVLNLGDGEEMEL